MFHLIDYKYFRENFGFPNLTRRIDEQIRYIREFLSVSSPDDSGRTKSCGELLEALRNPILSMPIPWVQVAINKALKVEILKYNKKKFEKAASFASTQTKNQKDFLPIIKKAFLEAGVVLIDLTSRQLKLRQESLMNGLKYL